MPIIMAFLAISIFALSGQALPKFAQAGQLITIVILCLFTGALGEELGWRGTALPRLQSRWNALSSSLILGVLWGLYHLPSFLLSGLPLQNAPLIPFLLGALSLTILVTWTFNHTNGSLIPVFLYHFSFNLILNVTGIISNPALFGLFAGITLVASIIVVVLDLTMFVQLTSPLTEWSGMEELD